MIDFTMKDVEM